VSPTIPALELDRHEQTLRAAIAEQQIDHTFIRQLRREAGPDVAALIAESTKLQRKAIDKFGQGTWWVTERSLQQATAWQVAAWKAPLLGPGDAYDLCCGIGGDALRIGSETNVRLVAVDNDPRVAPLARENLRLNLSPDRHGDVQVRCQDARTVRLPVSASLHIDPDRRTGGARTTQPDRYAPDWDTVESMIQRCQSAIVKLAPAANLPDRPDRHRLWISLGKSVREQTLLVGETLERAARRFQAPVNLKIAGHRSAVVILSDCTANVFSGSDECDAEIATQPGRWILDPDPAIRAAGLTEAFADRHELTCLGSPSGFLTGECPIANHWGACESVLWVGSSDDRKLRKALRSLDSYPGRVKTRGVSVNPNVLEMRYRKCGQKPVTLWIGRIGKRQFAAISQPDG